MLTIFGCVLSMNKLHPVLFKKYRLWLDCRLCVVLVFHLVLALFSHNRKYFAGSCRSTCFANISILSSCQPLSSHFIVTLTRLPFMQPSMFLKNFTSAALFFPRCSLHILPTTACFRQSVHWFRRNGICHNVTATPCFRHHFSDSAAPPPVPTSHDLFAGEDPSHRASSSTSPVIIVERHDGLDVRLKDRTTFVPLQWLRDHCTSSAVYDAKTNSRLSPVPLCAEEWQVRKITVDPDGTFLRVIWSDGRKSSYNVSWLAATVLPKKHIAAPAPHDFLNAPPQKWEGRPVNPEIFCMSECSLPTVSNAILELPSGFMRACAYLHRFGVVFIDQLEASESATRAMIEHFGVLRNTLFGSFWTFEANGAMDDLAYTNSYIPPHTDGTYFEEAPGLQIFHCIDGSYSGGITSLIDGFALADRMRLQNADAFSVLCNVKLPFHYIGDGYHFSNRTHIFTLDEDGRVVEFRYNNCDRAPLDAATLTPFPQAGAPSVVGAITYERIYSALRMLHNLLEDASMKVQFKLTPGKAIVINNRRVLHARSEFVGSRRLCGAYVQQEEWIGRVRHLINTVPLNQ